MTENVDECVLYMIGMIGRYGGMIGMFTPPPLFRW